MLLHFQLYRLTYWSRHRTEIRKSIQSGLENSSETNEQMMQIGNLALSKKHGLSFFNLNVLYLRLISIRLTGIGLCTELFCC